MAKEVKVLVACGSGVATSTIAQEEIKDIAKKCHVGVSTVSRAMNNHPDINPETKEKILKAIEEAN